MGFVAKVEFRQLDHYKKYAYYLRLEFVDNRQFS